MTNTQLYLSLGIPAFLVLTNIGITLALMAGVNTRMDRLEARMDRIEARMDRIEADLRRFFELYGRHDKAIEVLEKKAGL